MNKQERTEAYNKIIDFGYVLHTCNRETEKPEGENSKYYLSDDELLAILDELNETGETKEGIFEQIKTYFEENEEIFEEAIEDLDSWNGYLNDDRYYPMDELNEFYHETEPMEILYRAFYGHDHDNYTTDEHGEKHYSEFNPNRGYFYYNGYGNLVSTDYKDYSDQLDDYFVRSFIDNYYNLSCSYPVELEELIEKYTEMEEE